MSDERLMELRDALYLGLDNYYPNMIGELMEAVTGLKAENKQLKEKLNKYLDENGNRYIYQDSLGEDWYFYDLDVFNEIREIVNLEGEDENNNSV